METNDHKSIGYLLERTTRIVKLSYSQKFNEMGFDITPEQWVILELISKKDGLYQSEIAGSSFKDAPTVSRILDLLEKKQYVVRSKQGIDRRARLVELTEKGQELVKKIGPVADQLRDQGWKNLTDEDYKVFLKIVDQVFSNYFED